MSDLYEREDRVPLKRRTTRISLCHRCFANKNDLVTVQCEFLKTLIDTLKIACKDEKDVQKTSDLVQRSMHTILSVLRDSPIVEMYLTNVA